VPLIFAGPGITQGGRCRQPAELLDIYPTLVELCRLPAQRGLEGHSLLPQLRDADAKRRWPAITTHNIGNHAIRTDRWRYIHYADGSEELYDMMHDPNEWTNLVGQVESRDVIGDLAQWLPRVNLPPAPGSAHRILVKQDGVWLWENQPIRAEALEE
jgi:arylsulfatase A-like enzyme